MLTICPWYISNWNSQSRYTMNLVKHRCMLSYFFFTPLFLLILPALTITNTFWACLFDFRVGQINPGTFGTALTSCCSGQSGSSMLLSCSISDSTSATRLSSLSFGLSKSPFRLCQYSESEMLADALPSSHLTGWWLILQMRRKFNISVRPPGRFSADKGGGKGDPSDNLNAAPPACWKSDHDALTISCVSEIYRKAVICFFWVQNSFLVAHRFWLPSHMSKKSWTVAIVCSFLPSAYFFISELFVGFVVSNSGSVPAKIPL